MKALAKVTMMVLECEQVSSKEFEFTVRQTTFEGEPKQPLVWRVAVGDVLDLNWKMEFIGGEWQLGFGRHEQGFQARRERENL